LLHYFTLDSNVFVHFKHHLSTGMFQWSHFTRRPLAALNRSIFVRAYVYAFVYVHLNGAGTDIQLESETSVVPGGSLPVAVLLLFRLTVTVDVDTDRLAAPVRS